MAAAASQVSASLLRCHVECDEHAPGAIRRELSGRAELGSLLADSLLVATELVTNAIRHSGCRAGDQLLVAVERHAGRLRISVKDPGISQQKAAICQAAPGDGGLGLRIVEQLSARWGTERRRSGYTVWAELELASAG